MKNASIFIDVDLTLVDERGLLYEGAAESLQRLKDAGCHLFLWSSNGAEYARKVASLHRVDGLFESFSAKPDIIVDDMPSTARAPFEFDVNSEGSWESTVSKILDRHVD